MHRNYDSNNAPIHVYWYDDRVEFSSPGGPYGNVSIENFGKPGTVSYRNPNIASVMRNIGLVQHYGFGMQIAHDAMAENGNPPIEFEVDNHLVKVILRKKQ
jgi:ATP-dependent DNA helicase RecG